MLASPEVGISYPYNSRRRYVVLATHVLMSSVSISRPATARRRHNSCAWLAHKPRERKWTYVRKAFDESRATTIRRDISSGGMEKSVEERVGAEKDIELFIMTLLQKSWRKGPTCNGSIRPLQNFLPFRAGGGTRYLSRPSDYSVRSCLDFMDSAQCHKFHVCVDNLCAQFSFPTCVCADIES